MDIGTKIEWILDWAQRNHDKVCNAELAMFFMDKFEGEDDAWMVDLGCPSQHVLLGEVRGEFIGEGRTLDLALNHLISQLKEKAQ